jgi:hypothetical protein
MKKNYHHPIFVQYKTNHINLFSLYSMKKKFNKKKETKLKRKKKFKKKLLLMN